MTQIDQNLDLILFGWVDALRRRDPDRIADRLAPDIVWQGLRRDLVCPNRTAVLHNITAGGPVRERATGIEVAAIDDHRVLLGVQLPGVTEFFGEPSRRDVRRVHDQRGRHRADRRVQDPR